VFKVQSISDHLVPVEELKTSPVLLLPFSAYLLDTESLEFEQIVSYAFFFHLSFSK